MRRGLRRRRRRGCQPTDPARGPAHPKRKTGHATRTPSDARALRFATHRRANASAPNGTRARYAHDGSNQPCRNERRWLCAEATARWISDLNERVTELDSLAPRRARRRAHHRRGCAQVASRDGLRKRLRERVSKGRDGASPPPAQNTTRAQSAIHSYGRQGWGGATCYPRRRLWWLAVATRSACASDGLGG